VLEASGLVKRYGEVVALDGCSFRVPPGRLVGFVGANGAGKTTAMRAVFGLVAPDDGTVHWDGRPVGPQERVRFGYMPEQRGLYPKMAAGEQLAYLARLHGMARPAAERAAVRWLEELGLAERRADRVEALSHGNQQRVQLAAAVVHDPDVLVLDEPFNGLDPLGVDAMEQVLRAQAERGTAILFSSHQLDLVEGLCDDVTVVHRGRDVLSGRLADLRAASGRRRVDVEFRGSTRWEPSGPAGVEVTEVGPGRVSLLTTDAVEPEQLLAAARAAGEVLRFSVEPPRLAELYREAVRR
jgi:ABC-2 type transport system ATP-binding protein